MRWDTKTESVVTLQNQLLVLEQLAQRVPQDDNESSTRELAIVRSVRALDNIGIDGESLFRFAAFSLIISPILTGLVVNEPAPTCIDIRGWSRRVGLLDHGMNLKNPADLVRLVEALHLLRRWVQVAPLTEVLRWQPSSDELWDEVKSYKPLSSNETEPYEWFWQRNTAKDPNDWSTESLHLEYKLMNGVPINAFPENLLSARPLPEATLEREIARRAVLDSGQRSSSNFELSHQIQKSAVNFLSGKKYREAVGLYEFLCGLNSEDIHSINNLGFCLIPLEPGEALTKIDLAISRGFKPYELARYNRCCCLRLVNRESEVLREAEDYWNRGERNASFGGTIWMFEDDGLVLEEASNLDLPFAILGRDAAVILAKEDRIKIWNQRIGDLETRG